MNREYEEVDLSLIDKFKAYSTNISQNPRIRLYYDMKLKDDLNDFMPCPWNYVYSEVLKRIHLKHRFERFIKIVQTARQGANGYNGDLYQKCRFRPEEKKPIAEMMFTTQGDNYRIYCKELYTKGYKHIVMVELYDKKTDETDKKMENIFNRIKNYEYEV